MDDPHEAVHREAYYAYLLALLVQEGVEGDVALTVADAWLRALERWDAHIRPHRD